MQEVLENDVEYERQATKRERRDRWEAKVAREREELDDEDEERRLAQATCTVCGVCGSADPWHWASGCAVEEYHSQSLALL